MLAAIRAIEPAFQGRELLAGKSDISARAMGFE
jgi:hypothetical protein